VSNTREIDNDYNGHNVSKFTV